MSTCNRLDLESLGSWPTMPKSFPTNALDFQTSFKEQLTYKCRSPHDWIPGYQVTIDTWMLLWRQDLPFASSYVFDLVSCVQIFVCRLLTSIALNWLLLFPYPDLNSLEEIDLSNPSSRNQGFCRNQLESSRVHHFARCPASRSWPPS